MGILVGGRSLTNSKKPGWVTDNLPPAMQELHDHWIHLVEVSQRLLDHHDPRFEDAVVEERDARLAFQREYQPWLEAKEAEYIEMKQAEYAARRAARKLSEPSKAPRTRPAPPKPTEVPPKVKKIPRRKHHGKE